MLEFLLRLISFFIPTPGVPFWGYVLVSIFRGACVIQWAGICLLCYWGMYSPMAGSPGARDGTGLLFVMGGVFLIGSLLALVLSWIESWLISFVIPDFPQWNRLVAEEELLNN